MNTTEEDEVGLLVVHGATDAPAVDVIARDVATLVSAASYRDITNYITVPASNYTLDIAASSNAEARMASATEGDVVASYDVDLSGYGGNTAVVFASGFLSADENNQNGEAFGLYGATPEGDVIEFSTVTSIEDKVSGVVTEYRLNQNYPNPFNPETTISFSLLSRQNVTLKVYTVTGQEVATLANETFDAGAHQIRFNASELSSGVYFYRIEAGDFESIRRMMLVK
ncbi:MAG: T9SS type A sorting domain-containing protein, partial [Caldithrix sp.]|nr:T9SS type A sorting domain-containing protein [Caldithrix sp.]